MSRPAIPVTPENIRAAQMEVLQLKLRAASEETSRKELQDRANQRVQEEIDQYITMGMPAEAFTPTAMRQAALEDTVEKVRRMPGLGARSTVARAQRLYGVDPEEVAHNLPAPDFDVPTIFRQYLQETQPIVKAELQQQLSKMIITPSVAEDLVEVATKDGSDAAWRELLHLLRNDWSRYGLNYLYRQLQAAQGESRQLDIINTLEGRSQMLCAQHTAILDKTSSPTVRETLFAVADRAMSLGDPEARQFLLAQLKSPVEQNRTLALKTSGRHQHELGQNATRTMTNVVMSEKDPQVRAQQVRALGRIIGPAASQAREQLLQILKNDPSLEVRIAALETIHLSPPLTARMPSPDGDLIERIRQAIGPNPPTELQEAFEDKMAQYERNSQERRQWVQEHQERVARVMAGQPSQTQPDPTAEDLVASLASTTDPDARVALLRKLARSFRRDEVQPQMLELLRNDPSVDVRIAALEVIPLSPMPHMQAKTQALIEKIRAAVGENPPRPLQRALDRKVKEHELRLQSNEQLQRRYGRSAQPEGLGPTSAPARNAPAQATGGN